jgi:hypothetical protein
MGTHLVLSEHLYHVSDFAFASRSNLFCSVVVGCSFLQPFISWVLY